MYCPEKFIMKEMHYANKVILAPMVRVSTLPVRLLCLDYGADLVYSEELIDWKLLASERRYNDQLGTVDYVDPSDGTVTFRTCADERSRVILQMGTCDPDRALKVAQKFENDVAGIDINMGCPKEFSIKGGMGAALMQKPEKVKSILTTLVTGVRIPVTCKIRLLETLEKTLEFCRMVESCGVAALAIHGRRREERPRHPNHDDIIQKVAASLSIPVIANGGSRTMSCWTEVEQFWQRCGTSSVMVARAAMWNMSVFRREGLLPLDHVITRLLKLCIRYDHPFTQVKYTVQQMLRDLQETPRGKRFLESQTLQEICDIWGLGELCRSTLPAPSVSSHTAATSEPANKRPRLDDDVIPGQHQFIRGHYKPEQLPKTVLHTWTRLGELPLPTYTVTAADKLFRAVCTVQGARYSSLWEKNKKFAEQGAALTCIIALGIGGVCSPAPITETERAAKAADTTNTNVGNSTESGTGADSSENGGGTEKHESRMEVCPVGSGGGEGGGAKVDRCPRDGVTGCEKREHGPAEGGVEAAADVELKDRVESGGLPFRNGLPGSDSDRSATQGICYKHFP